MKPIPSFLTRIKMTNQEKCVHNKAIFPKMGVICGLRKPNSLCRWCKYYKSKYSIWNKKNQALMMVVVPVIFIGCTWFLLDLKYGRFKRKCPEWLRADSIIVTWEKKDTILMCDRDFSCVIDSLIQYSDSAYNGFFIKMEGKK